MNPVFAIFRVNLFAMSQRFKFPNSLFTSISVTLKSDAATIILVSSAYVLEAAFLDNLGGR